MLYGKHVFNYFLFRAQGNRTMASGVAGLTASFPGATYGRGSWSVSKPEISFKEKLGSLLLPPP